MPYKYSRVCPICQRPRVVNLSSHLLMVHALDATQRAKHLKSAVVCPPTPLIQASSSKFTTNARQTDSKPKDNFVREPYTNFQLTGGNSIEDRIPQIEKRFKTVGLKKHVEEGKEVAFSKLLKRDDRQGPIIVHINGHDWLKVEQLFREAEQGGNLPPGWILWRVYAVNTPGFYTPVLIKETDSTETKFYRVYNDWLLAYYPQFRDCL